MDSQAIQFGMINSMRTNNVVVDTLICLLIPVFFKFMYDSTAQFGWLWAYLRSLHTKPTHEVIRRIEIKQHFNSWGKVRDHDQHNHILQKAISIYLSEHLDMTSQSGRYELLENVKPTPDAATDDEASQRHSYGYCSERDQLQTLGIGALPPLNAWVKLEEGVEFMHEIKSGQEDNHDNSEGGGNGVTESTVTFLLRSSLADGTTRIDDFVQRAYKSYQAAVMAKHQKDKSRYMYMAASSGDASAESTAAVQKYKRYALGEDKTFDSLFFEDKAPLLALLGNFLHKSGKFGIPGFPYKLGLLLHGPPGTGKTSLIKAIAQHTKRHIVNISLSKIKTNQELMDMMFDLKFGLAGEDLPIKLGFDSIVFVMEDVDCASNIVLARSSDAGAPQIPSPEMDDLDLVTMSKLEGHNNDKAIGPIINPSKWDSKDKLNLSGLLNVLDGVVDSPGRILIMTTNHPEKLDPALVRPGRVNKKLMLGHISSRQTQLMVEHFFATTLDAKQRKAIDDVFANTTNNVSPAQVEQLCAEYDHVVGMLDALAKLGD
ncbi:hypothetical protein DYB37_009446 [Aphanomyces astaci]|uniref:AAA+ ATPase domain-containing protein n=2 Tax=Aphanomyces astaci TaxID=112090 RepID=A0A3R7CPP8_APHAT|nr:hypothetical protein DYB35_007707 [Aphanomyces astaci]RHZ32625.1 hypothetical protein DYB37_009446 [Aphanomyces astaci]